MLNRLTQAKQSGHMKRKNKSEIAYHKDAPKKTNLEVFGKFNYPFIAETLYICMADINSLLNIQTRSYELMLFQHSDTYNLLRAREQKKQK